MCTFGVLGLSCEAPAAPKPTLTPVRVTRPHGARSAGAAAPPAFLSTLLHGFLCKSDFCEGLILV